jgi:hypothetical protein
MSALQYIFRLLVQIVKQPAVQDALTTAAREASREASKTLIREVSNGFSRYEQKRTTPTVR